MNNCNQFANRVAIVTGSTSGMGRQVALDLAAEGCYVMASGRNQEAGKLLMETFPEHIYFLPGDVKLPETNSILVESAMSKFGRLDHIVLAAGQLGIGRLDEVTIDDWRDTFATNVDAVFYLLREALPIMRQQESGTVVVIGSVAAFHAFPNHPAYCASKGALVALISQLALDFGPHARINLVCPAQVRTPLLEASVEAFENPEEILGETAKRLPMKRLGTSEDIAQAVLFLLSDRSSWTTGSYFTIDGGFLAS